MRAIRNPPCFRSAERGAAFAAPIPKTPGNLRRPISNAAAISATPAASARDFPDDGGPDAIRFTVSRDDGAVLRLYYVAERDHHPFAHGPLEYSRTAAPLTPAHACGEPLDAASTGLRGKLPAAKIRSLRRVCGIELG